MLPLPLLASVALYLSVAPIECRLINSANSTTTINAPRNATIASPHIFADVPEEQPDGTCATYTIAELDTCDAIARANSITWRDITAYNLNTWGFSGCDNLQSGQIICLSLGAAPLPASDPNAVCGPWVVGTRKPDDINADLATLNPCPFNACCSIWGQCGITAEFCTTKDSAFIGPGAAPSGESSCISNCGMDIVTGVPVAKPLTIGYFQGSNFARPCLVMRPSQVPSGKYTHLHYAFANISDALEIKLSDAEMTQWQDFKATPGVKRIISIGGWAFSSSEESRGIFAHATSGGGNRQTFIDNIVRFIDQEGIDGVDFDWEYPQNTPIDGGYTDAENFSTFIDHLRLALGTLGTKSISAAVPAGYWNLKAFPIKDLADTLDYVVFMTYDLHGQWDFGNKYSSSGCPNGDCLRSHINLTETDAALSMITKAGVPAGKVVVGISSYGRSFEMSQLGCTGPTCTYTGPESGAIAGDCTETAGILANGEIQNILNIDSTATTWYDTSSNSDVMVYNQTQWVSFMSEATKASRTGFYISLGFLGTADWAVDFNYVETAVNTVSFPDCDQADKYHTIDDIIGDPSIPESCIKTYVLTVEARELQVVIDRYSSIMDDEYEEKFKAFSKMVHQQAPAALSQFYAGDDVDDYFTCEYEYIDRKPHVKESGTCSMKHIPGKYVHHDIRVYYTVKDQQAFCSRISDDYGLDCDWLYYEWVGQSQCCFQGVCSCHHFRHQPTPKSDFDVYDPGAQIRGSLASYRELSEWLFEIALEHQLDLFPGSIVDAIDAATMTVYAAQAAVNSMQQVADAGEKAEKEEEKQRKQMILMFVTAFLFVLPGVGWLAEAAELAAVGRIIALAAEARNVAVSLYEVIDDPKSAPMAIASMLFGGVATRDIAALGRAAQASRLMERDVLKSLGDDVFANVEKVRSVRQLCGL